MCMYVDAVHLRLSVNSSHCSSQEVQVNDANIVTSDVFTQNGIIHVVDKVCTQIRCCEIAIHNLCTLTRSSIGSYVLSKQTVQFLSTPDIKAIIMADVMCIHRNCQIITNLFFISILFDSEVQGCQIMSPSYLLKVMLLVNSLPTCI